MAYRFCKSLSHKTAFQSILLNGLTGKDSVIGADSIERVVRLTVFEAIPSFFPTEYVFKLSFFFV